MAEIKVEIDDSALQRVIANGRKLGATSLERIRNTVAGVADKILARAIEKAPTDSGVLKRSGTSETRLSGNGLTATVSFGGMASKYAEVQHENPELTHTTAAFLAKYGLKKRVLGHKGGQAHFLHGANNSAWDSWMQSWTSAVITRRLEKEADKLL